MNFKKWLLNEVSKELVKQVKDAVKNKEKPFKHIFKGDDRIVLPYESITENERIPLEIIKKTKKDGYDIDFTTGLISKDKVIQALYAQPAKPAKIQIKMGRYIFGKGNFTEEEKSWWTHQGEPIKSLEVINNKDKYVVVISIHPIDIIRMSDHDNWYSCHAPTGSFFNCAVAEAKNAGAIAYVVAKDDISKINIKDDEIFEDKDRDIKGVQPIARLRIRLFKNKKDDHELAMPEDRVYGLDLEGLQDTVRKWAFAHQKELFEVRPKLKDYELMGGSYQDNTGSVLFNKFFNDNKDKGEADYGGEDEEFEGMLDTYDRESQEILDQYNSESEIASFYYSVESSDGHPYVHYSANIFFEFPNQKLLKEFNYKDEDVLKKWLNNNDIYAINQVEVRQDKNGVQVHFDVYDEDGNSNPDSFRDFCGYITDELKGKEDDLHNTLYKVLIENEFLALSFTVNKIYDVEEDQEQDEETHELNNLENFSTVVDSSAKAGSTGMTFRTRQSITIAEFNEKNAKDPEKFALSVLSISVAVKNTIIKEVTNVVGAFFERIEEIEKRQLKLFKEPEFQHNPPSSVNAKRYVNVSYIENITKKPEASIKITFAFPINNLDADEKTHEVIDMIKMMDQSFESLKFQILKSSEAIIKPYMQKYFNV